MSDKDQKTEEPSSKRIDQYREEGKVAVGRDLISMAVLWGSALTIVVDPTGARGALIELTRRLLGRIDRFGIDDSALWVRPVASVTVALLLPVGIVAVVAALVSGLSQTKGLIAFKSIRPKFSKINPFPKLKTMFVSKQAAVSIAMSLAKVGVVAVVAYRLLADEMTRFPGLVSVGLGESLSYLLRMTIALGWRIGSLLLIFATIDYLWTRHTLHEDMKMSKQELKDEHKEQEGDPQVRARQRAKMRQVNRRLVAEVSKASVVVVNPTHYSVALRYDIGAVGAPRVVAKGKDNLAARIREIARKHGVPIVHNPPLTRQLFAQCDEDREIPPHLYGAVAEVLAFVFRLRGGRREARS